MNATRKQSGFSMIELLVAMAIGGFLIIGAVTMQSNSRKTFTVNEQQARLQETARYVISVLEPEMELAGGYGFTNRPEDIWWTSGGANTPSTILRTWSTQVGGLPAGLESCGKHYALDVISSIQAANNAYSLSCAATYPHNGVSDTITIRHAGTVAVAGDPSKYQLIGSRTAQGQGRLYVGTTPSLTATDREIRDMVVNSYYVATRSDARSDIPALRAKILTTDGVAPFVDDQEVIRGVEDIQVEFGVDPGIDQNGDGYADYVSAMTARYVPPNNAVVNTGQVSAVRLWVRVRAEDPEQGFTDNRTYSYAGTTFTPTATDHYRRVLMSRTIFLRNARGLEIVNALPPT
jgi:type IV pilus assembly protein PilW